MHDLNVLWSNTINPKGDTKVLNTLAMLQDSGYNVAALNHIVTGKIPSNHKCPIDKQYLKQKFPKMTILSRITVVLDDNLQQSLAPLCSQYDIIAIRPLTEKALQNATTLGSDIVDLISLDCSKRIPFFLRHKTVCAGVERGLKFEIIYASSLVSNDSRKHIITNALNIIRSSRKRGLIISSEASSPLHIRGPYDVINLACLWGLDHMRAHDALGKTAAQVVKNSFLRSNSYKQTIMAIEDSSNSESGIDSGTEKKKRSSEAPSADRNTPTKKHKKV